MEVLCIIPPGGTLNLNRNGHFKQVLWWIAQFKKVTIVLCKVVVSNDLVNLGPSYEMFREAKPSSRFGSAFGTILENLSLVNQNSYHYYHYLL
jgi:hypothetical protein